MAGSLHDEERIDRKPQFTRARRRSLVKPSFARGGLIYAITPTKMLVMACRGVALSLFIAACLAIVVGSMVPAMAPPDKFYVDKLVHLSAYALVATLGCFAVRPRWWPILIAVLIGASGCIEIAQKLVGSRTASMGDFLASVLGVAVGYCFVQFVIGLHQVRQAFAR